MIELDNGNGDALMWYNSLLKYANEDALNFTGYEQRLPANPISPPPQEATHCNERFIKADTLNWTEIFKDMSYIAMNSSPKLIKYTDREEFDVNTTEEEIDNMKNSNGTIRFMNVMQ